MKKRKQDADQKIEENTNNFFDFKQSQEFNSRHKKLKITNEVKIIPSIEIKAVIDDKQIWRSIPNFDNYSISQDGQVKNITTGKILSDGKESCTLIKNKAEYRRSKARLLREVFTDLFDGNKEWRIIEEFPKYSLSIDGQLRNEKTLNILKCADGQYHLTKDNNTFGRSRNILLNKVFPDIVHNDDDWFGIPGYSNYLIKEDGKVKNKTTNSIKEQKTFTLFADNGETVTKTTKFLLNLAFPFKFDDGGLWKTILAYDEYKISDQGLLFNVKYQRFLKGNMINGYLSVDLCKIGNSGVQKDKFYIHQLVINTFIGTPPTVGHTVNHLNGIKHDNRLSNLKYDTLSEQTLHAYRTGLLVNGSSKGVTQMTLDGKFIANFVSASEAARQTKSNRTTICRVCRGENKSTNGFKWKWQESNKIEEPWELDEEEWKICSIATIYEISSYGRIRNSEKILSPLTSPAGYKSIPINLNDGSRKMKRIHRLVAFEFLPYPESKVQLVVDHLDSNPMNNYEYFGQCFIRQKEN